MRQRVLLVSTVHPATDSRIFYKIAPSLAAHYEVFFMRPGAGTGRHSDGFTCISLPFFEKLIFRLLLSHPVMLWKCLRLKPDLVHIFVPELLPAAFIFHWLGAKVIYEVQENLYKKFSIKQYNNNPVFRKLFRFFDRAARRDFHLIFTETSYLEEYKRLAKHHAVVQNFVSLPQIDSIPENPSPILAKHQFFYAGVISVERCFDTLMLAFQHLNQHYPDFHVHFFGPVRLGDRKLDTFPGYKEFGGNLTFYGYQDQKTALRFARKCIAGIALLKPVADYPESYTTKMFEYMALGLPVITSDFPLYRQVMEHSECGFCISPYSADNLYEKLRWLIEHPSDCLKMGKNGRKSVEAMYNWAGEEQKLLSFYKTLP
ncbi:glycosyltransferase [Dyadobacter luticola]|uniref:Glycosyltransferase family 4 protein n=1 Tax=Dyadobacter luticola TaxID=1979387 RepID=A0A5R9KVB6_9BACT|nr:glycosyltransferase [Dyadobacter luticola]TLV00085.1 glycosyltransferase family 4 protein [Dyadobacter luticola]